MVYEDSGKGKKKIAPVKIFFIGFGKVLFEDEIYCFPVVFKSFIFGGKRMAWR